MKVQTYKGQSEFYSIPNIPQPLREATLKWVEAKMPQIHADTIRSTYWGKPKEQGGAGDNLLSAIFCNIADIEEATRENFIHEACDWFVDNLGVDFWSTIDEYWQFRSKYWREYKDNQKVDMLMEQHIDMLKPCFDILQGVKKHPVVVMNEQHTLLPAQEALLPEKYTMVPVPASGWDLEMIRAKSDQWGSREVILVSPIPALMSIRAKEGLPFRVMHNDKREKKELPDGKIISVLAKDGWELV